METTLYSTALLLYPVTVQELLNKIIRYVYVSNTASLSNGISTLILLLDEYISTQTDKDIDELQYKCWGDAVSGIREELDALNIAYPNIPAEIPEELDIRKLLDRALDITDYLNSLL